MHLIYIASPSSHYPPIPFSSPIFIALSSTAKSLVIFLMQLTPHWSLLSSWNMNLLLISMKQRVKRNRTVLAAAESAALLYSTLKKRSIYINHREQDFGTRLDRYRNPFYLAERRWSEVGWHKKDRLPVSLENMPYFQKQAINRPGKGPA